MGRAHQPAVVRSRLWGATVTSNHGTNAGYVAGCRDSCCRDAHAAYQRTLWRARYRRRVESMHAPALGPRRRLRALMALGWTMPALDTELGVPGATKRLVNSDRPVIHVDRARLVADVYERLCMTIPTGWAAERTRAIAVRRGWRPPLWWNDIDDPRDRTTGRRKQVA